MVNMPGSSSKNAPIRMEKAVREDGASLSIMGAQLRDPPETPHYHCAVMFRGFREGAQLLPRHAILSDSKLSTRVVFDARIPR